jgi:Ca-activated chloride channel family protein
MRSRLLCGTFLALSLSVLSSTPGALAEAPAPLLLILDASGSMWGQIEGENKIVIARRVLGDLVDGLPAASEVGLIAYGHRRDGDCDDIETVAGLGPLDKAALKATVGALNPKGKTPITKSVQAAFAELAGRREGATVILVSDGLETCGGDPCAAVKAAKGAGVRFVLHVVGFDVAGEDVSQLECAAQAGGGTFLSAENAGELGEALETAVAMPADVPIGRLVVEAVADGKLLDVSVTVTRAGGERVAGSRTYASAETNPRSLPLPDGRYEVAIQAVRIKGDVSRRFEVEIAGGSTVEKRVDFSTGEIAVGVTKNGRLSDATFQVHVAGTRDLAASGRTYTSSTYNPAVVRITSGSYEVGIGSVEIANKPVHKFGRVEVTPQGRVDLAHDFKSGTLRVGAVRGGELVDATVGVVDAASGVSVAGGRTYTSPTSNPTSFDLEPGRYKVTLKAVRLEGTPTKEMEVTVEAGGTVEKSADFGS